MYIQDVIDLLHISLGFKFSCFNQSNLIFSVIFMNPLLIFNKSENENELANFELIQMIEKAIKRSQIDYIIIYGNGLLKDVIQCTFC